MTSGVEAVGDVLTGAVAAGAVEPGHGPGGIGSHGACANCGAQLVGAFCHACGQNSHIHRNLTGFAHDLLHGVFHFDGKFWSTLPMLFFSPGDLTRRYIAGERARFVSPLAMFLFTVFLMFAALGSLPSQEPATATVNRDLSIPAMDKEIAQEQRRESALMRQIRAEIAAGRDAGDLIEERDQVRRQRHGYQIARDDKLLAAGLPLRPDHPAVAIDTSLSADAMEDRIDAARERERTLERAISADLRAGRDVTAQEAELDRVKDERHAYQAARKARLRSNGKTQGREAEESGNSSWLREFIVHARENPDLFVYRLQSSAYKYCWTLIPISTPLVWLLFFWKRQYKAYDHLVFVTISLSFMMLLVTALSVGRSLGLSRDIVVILAMLLPPLHMYRQLRGAYQLGRFSALLRTGAMGVMATIALSIYFLLLLALGAMH